MSTLQLSLCIVVFHLKRCESGIESTVGRRRLQWNRLTGVAQIGESSKVNDAKVLGRTCHLPPACLPLTFHLTSTYLPLYPNKALPLDATELPLPFVSRLDCSFGAGSWCRLLCIMLSLLRTEKTAMVSDERLSSQFRYTVVDSTVSAAVRGMLKVTTVMWSLRSLSQPRAGLQQR